MVVKIKKSSSSSSFFSLSCCTSSCCCSSFSSFFSFLSLLLPPPLLLLLLNGSPRCRRRSNNTVSWEVAPLPSHLDGGAARAVTPPPSPREGGAVTPRGGGLITGRGFHPFRIDHPAQNQTAVKCMLNAANALYMRRRVEGWAFVL